VGGDAVRAWKDDVLILKTAPKPHPAFQEYWLSISPEQGTLKILASGVVIKTNGFGRELHQQFVEIRDAISGVYGTPGSKADLLLPGSLWTQPQYWMMGLLKKERSLSALWLSAKSYPDKSVLELPNDISTIFLNAVALSAEEGYLQLGYEFDGWDAYVNAKKAKQNKAF